MLVSTRICMPWTDLEIYVFVMLLHVIAMQHCVQFRYIIFEWSGGMYLCNNRLSLPSVLVEFTRMLR